MRRMENGRRRTRDGRYIKARDDGARKVSLNLVFDSTGGPGRRQRSAQPWDCDVVQSDRRKAYLGGQANQSGRAAAVDKGQWVDLLKVRVPPRTVY